MSFEIDAAARREALAVREAPIGTSEVRVGQMAARLAINQPGSSRYLSERLERMKPRTFGHLGIVVADCVTGMLAERPNRGSFGLLHETEEGWRPATAGDLTTWSSITHCWEMTLAESARRAILEPADEEREANIAALTGLWKLREHTAMTGLDLLGHLTSGCETASTVCMTRAYGMSKFLKTRGMEGETVRETLRRSPGPIIGSASLETAQLKAFDREYGGARYDERRMPFIVLRAINTGIYELTRAQTLNYDRAVEDFPVRHNGSVGNVPPIIAGPRIGCPILLTPRLIHSLWIGYVDSLARADLL